MSLSRLWAFLAVALPTLAALIATLQTVDLAYHLRAGGEILDTGTIPSVDAWTFTASGAPWTDQQWGAQVILAAGYRIGGWTGLVLLRAVLVAFIFGCLFEIARRQSLGLRRASWLALAAFIVSAAALSLRPQLFGMALFAGVLLLISDRRAHPGRLRAIPLIVLIWANVHGSFFLGPLVLGLAWLEDLHQRIERPHRALLVGVVSAAAACLTPFGVGVWTYAVGLSSNPEVTRRITEWQPTSLGDVPGILFFSSALIVAAMIVRRGRSTPWPTLIWLGVFFVVGAYAARGIAWWPLAAVGAIAGTLVTGPRTVRAEPAGPSLMRRLNASVAALVVLAGIALLPAWRPVDDAIGAPAGVIANAPPGITAALRDLARPGDRLLNPQQWGSWFEFALPEIPVAIDSRIELFPPEVWRGYDLVTTGGPGWDVQLAAWDPSVAVVAAEDEALADRLTANRWRSVYADADGSILVAPDR